uniref:Uncharacterized protein n=1 Tax=Oryza meridionalis TaxID=40149 RepID=A0A0E0D9H8_9ORYZ
MKISQHHGRLETKIFISFHPIPYTPPPRGALVAAVVIARRLLLLLRRCRAAAVILRVLLLLVGVVEGADGALGDLALEPLDGALREEVELLAGEERLERADAGAVRVAEHVGARQSPGGCFRITVHASTTPPYASTTPPCITTRTTTSGDLTDDDDHELVVISSTDTGTSPPPDADRTSGLLFLLGLPPLMRFQSLRWRYLLSDTAAHDGWPPLPPPCDIVAVD